MSNRHLKKDMIDVYGSGICKILLNLLKAKLKTDIRGKNEISRRFYQQNNSRRLC